MEWSPKDSLVVFSKFERIAIGVLLVLISTGATSGYWLPKVWPYEASNVDDRIAFQTEIEEWEVRNQLLVDSLTRVKAARDQRYVDNRKKWNKQRINTSPTKRKWKEPKPETVKVDYSTPMPNLGSVDANIVELDVLLRIGVPPKVARTWIKFRGRGGNFVRKEDVGKIYGMPDSTLQRILPYFKSPDLRRKRDKDASKTVIVNVNTSTIEELQTVNGIGPFFAKQIVRYRGQLGGFLSLTQVAETPGIPDSSFQTFRDQLTVTSDEPRLIRINQLNQQELSKHPYISRKQAEVIVLNRRNHGAFKSREDLLATIVLDTMTVDRLMPYLDFVE